MSVNTELSALLTKMGGTPLESDSNSDLIKKISNAYEGGGGSGGVSSYNDLTDRPFDVTNEYVTLFEEIVTFNEYPPEENLSYSELIDDDVIEVTYDGTKYSCQQHLANGWFIYGGVGPEGPDFSDYPFALASTPEGNMLYAQTQGSHTIKVNGYEETLSTTEDFDKAVFSAAYCILNVISVNGSTTIKHLDKTASEIIEIASRMPVFICDSTATSGSNKCIKWYICRVSYTDDPNQYEFEILGNSDSTVCYTTASPDNYPYLKNVT